MRDYYEILGIARGASDEEIKRAYRKLAHQYHPDKSGGDEAKFKEVNEAYQVLSNKEKRAGYDRFGHAGAGGGRNAAGGNPFAGGWPFGGANVEWDANFGGDMGDIFDIFNQFARAARARGADVQAEHRVTLEEAFQGTTVKFRGPAGKEVSVSIPPGVEDGQAIKVPGAGAMGERMPGDLYVVIRVAAHKTFERRGPDLIVSLSANLKDVLLGKKFSVPDIAGESIEVSVPRGHNLREPIKISGKGMPKLGFLKSRGDLYVRLDVKVPKISAKFTKALEDWDA